MLLSFVFLMLQFGFIAVTEAQSSLPQATESVPATISQTVKSLRKIKAADLDTTVPPAAKPLLTTLKHQLRDLIDNNLNSHEGRSRDIDEVQKIILQQLRREGVALRQDYVETGCIYGNIEKIAVLRLANRPDLVAATTTIGICCGEDTSLYVFRRSEGRWKLIIAQESNDYDEVSGAQGWFRYAVSPFADSGEFYLVTANITPWCTSNWQMIRYKVLREGVAPYQPKLLLEQKETIFLGDENKGAITMGQDGFRIEFDAAQNLDVAGVIVRKHIMAYRVEGDRVTRVPPFAAEPEGFLDELFNMPWEEAAKWVEPSALTAFRDWHRRIHSKRSVEDIHFFSSFIFEPPSCKVDEGIRQIGVEFAPAKEGGTLPDGMPEKIFFTVAVKNGDFFLKSVSTTPLPECGS